MKHFHSIFYRFWDFPCFQVWCSVSEFGNFSYKQNWASSHTYKAKLKKTKKKSIPWKQFACLLLLNLNPGCCDILWPFWSKICIRFALSLTFSEIRTFSKEWQNYQFWQISLFWQILLFSLHFYPNYAVLTINIHIIDNYQYVWIINSEWGNNYRSPGIFHFY